MKKTSSLIAIFASALSLSANAALYELTYISNDYGTLGSFTIDSEDIIQFAGDTPLGGNYVSNDYIQSLNFSHNGMTWGTEDIATGTTIAHSYSFIDGAPTTPSGNGALAYNEFGQGITTYHPAIGIRFGSEYVTGYWESELAAVPLPASVWLLLSGLAGLVTLAKKNHNKTLQLTAKRGS